MKRIMNLLLAGFLAVTFLQIDTGSIKASEKSAIQTEVESLSDKWSESTVDTSVYDASKDTITITTAEQFAALQQSTLMTNMNNFEGKTVLLGNDIDLGGKLWDKPIENFCGTFDGQNYQIRNFVSNGAALFKNLGLQNGDGGVIKNFAVSGSYYLSIVSKYNTNSGGYRREDICSGAIVQKLDKSTTANNGYRASGIRCMVNQEIEIIIDHENEPDDDGRNESYTTMHIGGMFGYLTNENNISGCNNYGNIKIDYSETSVQKIRYGNKFEYELSVGGITSEAGREMYPAQEQENMNIEKCLNYGNLDVHASVPRTQVSVGGVVGSTAKMQDIQYMNHSGNLLIQDCANFGNVKLWRDVSAYEGSILADEDRESGALFAVGGVIGSTGRRNIVTEESCNHVAMTIDRVSNSGQVTLLHNADVNNISEIGFAGGVMGLLVGSQAQDVAPVVKNSNNTGKLIIQSDMTGLPTTGHYISESIRTNSNLLKYTTYLPKNMLFSGNFIGGVISHGKPVTLQNNFSTAEFESSMKDSSYLKASSFVSVYAGGYTADNDMLNTNYAPDAYKQSEDTCGDDLSDSNKIYRSPRYRLRNADDSEDNYNSSPIPKYAGCSALGTLSNDYEFQEMNANSGETFDILMRDEAISKSPILTTIHKLRFTSENGGSWENSMGGDGTDSIISKEIPVYLTAYGKDTYNVGLVWGAMDFKYARTQESAQEQGLSLGWNGNDKKNNRLSITNNSVEPIYSNVSLNTARNTTLQDSNLEAKLDVEIFEKDAETPKETEVGTKSNGDVIVTKEHSIPTEATQHTYLTLSGQPQGDFDKKMIAMLLVTVSATQAGE